MRCYLGGSADRVGDLPIEAHMENTIKVFKSVRSQALDLGVKIAIENHDGDMQAREARIVIRNLAGFRGLLPGHRKSHGWWKIPWSAWKCWRLTW